jgi:hypothetical protein
VESAYRVWVDLVADLMTAPLLELPAERIAITLIETLSARGCAAGFGQVAGSVDGVIYPLDDDFGCGHREVERWCREHAQQLHPVVLQYRQLGHTCMVQSADVPERFADARVRACWADATHPWDAHEQLVLPLCARPTEYRAFALGRDRRWSRNWTWLDGCGAYSAGSTGRCR